MISVTTVPEKMNDVTFHEVQFFLRTSSSASREKPSTRASALQLLEHRPAHQEFHRSDIFAPLLAASPASVVNPTHPQIKCGWKFLFLLA